MEKLKFNPMETEKSNETERVFLGSTKDGVSVYDRADSHLHTEGGLNSDIIDTALSVIDSRDRGFIVEQVNFKNPIGVQTCVNTGVNDEIVMVFRKKRSGLTPMVKNREPQPSNSAIIIMKRECANDENYYELKTAYVGKLSPREPWDPSIDSKDEQRRCQEYWDSHALIYDERLIDIEKTNEFNNLSDAQKKNERIGQKTLYTGIFTDVDKLHGKITPTLEKVIEKPHITTNFRPNTEQLHLDQLGSNARIFAIGYGNDGKNEGLLVRVEAEDPAIQQAYEALQTPHITLSISKDAHAKDTAFLDFKPIAEPFELDGQYGLYIQGDVVRSESELMSDNDAKNRFCKI